VQRWGEAQTRFIAPRGVTVAVGAARGCHRRHLCAACGVAVAVVAPRVVLRVLSSGGRCGAWVSPPPFLRRVWYCGCGQCSACGVEVTVVAPRQVLRALSSGGRCGVWVSLSPSLQRVWC
jgi:hypothetical protein